MPRETYAKWVSPSLDREMELLVFGERGAPVIVCPTSGARFYEWKDFKMVDSLAGKIDSGLIQLYCVDSVSLQSWYNDRIHPRERVWVHNRWEAYIKDELVPFIRSVNPNPFIITAGASFGAYLAVNFAFKHPELVRKTVGISGSYSIKRLLDGYYDEESYFNDPVSYLKNIEDESLLARIRRTEIALVTSDHDIGICRERTFDLSRVLGEKGVGHTIHEWGGNTGHDWPYWREMIGHYL